MNNPVRLPLPDTKESELEYRCFCGYIGTYDKREAHRELHRAALKAEKKR